MFCSSFKRINKRNILKRYQTKEVYERKTPIEHVLLRPGYFLSFSSSFSFSFFLSFLFLSFKLSFYFLKGMYVGQINPSILNTWIFNNNTKRMEKLNIYVSPALVKVNIISLYFLTHLFIYFFIHLFL